MNGIQKATPQSLGPATEEALRDYAAAAYSPNTRRVYAQAVTQWQTWASQHDQSSLPATPTGLCGWLESLARGGKKWSTIQTWFAAIRSMHTMARIEPNPGSDPRVRLLLRGIKRIIGALPQQKKALDASAMRQILAQVDTSSLMGQRDKALLLIGWYGALRRSELAGIQVADLIFSEEGLELIIAHSKTGDDQTVGIARMPDKDLCGVTALKQWLARSNLTTGPIFRAVTWQGKLANTDLSARSVASIVKKYVALIGLDAKDFAGHSLRAGFATEAFARDIPPDRIMAVTRHKSIDMLLRYKRASALKAGPQIKIGL